MSRRPTRHYGERGGHTPSLSGAQKAGVTRARLAELRSYYGDDMVNRSWARMRGRVEKRREQWLTMMEAGMRGDKVTARALQGTVMGWLELEMPTYKADWAAPEYEPVWYA